MSFFLFLCVSRLLLRTEVEAIGNHIPSPGHRRCHLQKVGRKGNRAILSQCREPLVPT